MERKPWLARWARRSKNQTSSGSTASPLDGLSAAVPASVLEDLAGLLVRAAGEDCAVLEVCTCASRLAQSTGCAAMEWDGVAERAWIHAACGTWEEDPLRPFLEGTAPEWAFALGDAPVCASRDGSIVRARRWCRGPEGAASALAMPMRMGGKVMGALLFTYPTSRAFSADEVRIGRLVSCHAALVLRHRALAATVEQQAKRIARLVDDTERLLLSLRRTSAQSPPPGSAESRGPQCGAGGAESLASSERAALDERGP